MPPRGSSIKSKTRRSSNLNLVKDPYSNNSLDGAYGGAGVNQTPTDCPMGVGSLCGSGAADNGGVIDPPPQTVTYNPPYTYPETDAADCNTIKSMIEQVINYKMTSRMPSAQMAVYDSWLQYAQQRQLTACAVVPVPEPSNPLPPPTYVEPVQPVQPVQPEPDPTPIVETPYNDLPETVFEIHYPPVQNPVPLPVETQVQPSADNPPPVVVDVIPDVEPAVVPGGSTTDTQTPGIIETLFPPIVVPFPVNSGGGNGSSSNEAPAEDVRYINWFWVMFTVVSVIGVITYKKKTTA